MGTAGLVGAVVLIVVLAIIFLWLNNKVKAKGN